MKDISSINLTKYVAEAVSFINLHVAKYKRVASYIHTTLYLHFFMQANSIAEAKLKV